MAALNWLSQAFGFEVTLLVTDDAGAVGHAEMSFGDGRISIGGEWASPQIAGPAQMKSPASVSGCNTQFIRVELSEGLDEHCARAEAAGAIITQRPENQFYGARVYRALDPEGHLWSFDQKVADLTLDEMARASGLTLRTSLEP
jgi:uncharacterized glyoxalase superfamily protein PhnB